MTEMSKIEDVQTVAAMSFAVAARPSRGRRVVKRMALALALLAVALSTEPVFSHAMHFQPAGTQPISAAGAYPLALVLEPGTRGDVVET
jgi:hypothetical protein